MVQITKSLSFMASAACLSTMLFMSSCSKDDATMPLPEATISNIESAGGSNLKINGLEIIPPTIGQTGLGSLPAGYTKSAQNIAGLSNTRYLFGNAAKPWLPASNTAPTGAGTFLTLGGTKGSGVQVEVKNLVDTKKYKFTYYVSTLAVKNSSSWLGHTPYALALVTRLRQHGDEHFTEYTYFSSKYTGIERNNQWIKVTKEFEATNVDGYLDIVLQGESDNAVSYGNIFIPEGAIEEIK